MSLEIWDDDMAEAMEQAEGQQELEEGVLMENIGEMQQELGGLMESFKDFFEGDDISGDPEKDMENWHHQTEQNSKNNKYQVEIGKNIFMNNLFYRLGRRLHRRIRPAVQTVFLNLPAGQSFPVIRIVSCCRYPSVPSRLPLCCPLCS